MRLRNGNAPSPRRPTTPEARAGIALARKLGWSRLLRPFARPGGAAVAAAAVVVVLAGAAWIAMPRAPTEVALLADEVRLLRQQQEAANAAVVGRFDVQLAALTKDIETRFAEVDRQRQAAREQPSLGSGLASVVPQNVQQPGREHGGLLHRLGVGAERGVGLQHAAVLRVHQQQKCGPSAPPIRPPAGPPAPVAARSDRPSKAWQGQQGPPNPLTRSPRIGSTEFCAATVSGIPPAPPSRPATRACARAHRLRRPRRGPGQLPGSERAGAGGAAGPKGLSCPGARHPVVVRQCGGVPSAAQAGLPLPVSGAARYPLSSPQVASATAGVART